MPRVEMNGVRNRCASDGPVYFDDSDGEVVAVSCNEDTGYVAIDIPDLIAWLRENRPELLTPPAQPR